MLSYESKLKGGNKYDAWNGPTDTKIDGGSYDYLTNSLKDVVETTTLLDKPAVAVNSEEIAISEIEP